jgi:hypothetical protein
MQGTCAKGLSVPACTRRLRFSACIRSGSRSTRIRRQNWERVGLQLRGVLPCDAAKYLRFEVPPAGIEPKYCA